MAEEYSWNNFFNTTGEADKPKDSFSMDPENVDPLMVQVPKLAEPEPEPVPEPEPAPEPEPVVQAAAPEPVAEPVTKPVHERKTLKPPPTLAEAQLDLQPIVHRHHRHEPKPVEETVEPAAQAPAPEPVEETFEPAAQEPAPEPVEETFEPVAEEPAPEPVEEINEPAGEEPAPEPVEEIVEPAAQEPAPEPAEETVGPAAQEPAPMPIEETVGPAAEPVFVAEESKPEPEPHAEPEPVAETKEAPVPELPTFPDFGYRADATEELDPQNLPAAMRSSKPTGPTFDLGGGIESVPAASASTKDVLEDILNKIPDSPKGNFVPAHVPVELRVADKNEDRFDTSEFGTNEFTVADQDAKSLDNVHVDEILRLAVERNASDIHLTVGLPPIMRLDGDLVPLPYKVLKPEDTRRLVYEVLTNEQLTKFEQSHELDFGYGVRALGRFRFNVYFQKGSVAGAMRSIPTEIPSFDQLGLPSIIRDMSKRTSGLVLVTGPTGSGKSTTIASMIDDINETRQAHILTIEDPIEYLHRHKKCMVNQREMHSDTYSFASSLRAVLREDPDIILVGELRDLETIEAALTLAETGHLVFGTLHTRNAPSTIDRVVDVFPSDQQDQIRVLLGNTLEGVISQQLLPRLGGGRSPAIEIMIGTPAIKNLIREGKTHQMYSIIETSANVGMQTMDRSLAELFKHGLCTYDDCLMRSVDKESFARLAKGVA